MNCKYPDFSKRDNPDLPADKQDEKGVHEKAAECTELDSKRTGKELIFEIYKESLNAKQDPDARIAKSIAKFSALLVNLSIKADETSKRNLQTAEKTLKVSIVTLVVAIITLVVVIIQLIITFK